VFCAHGGALAEPLAGGLFAGGLFVVAHPKIERAAMSTPAARVRVIMRNPPTEFGKTAIVPCFCSDFSGNNKEASPRLLLGGRVLKNKAMRREFKVAKLSDEWTSSVSTHVLRSYSVAPIRRSRVYKGSLR
jgi:hypothetical protein